MAYRSRSYLGKAAWDSILNAGHPIDRTPRSYAPIHRRSSIYNARPSFEETPRSSHFTPRRNSIYNAEPPTGRSPRSHRSTPRPAPPARDPSLDLGDSVYYGTTSDWRDDDGQGQTLRELQDQQRRSKHRQDAPETVDWEPLVGLAATGLASLAAKVISNSSKRDRPTSSRLPSTKRTHADHPSRDWYLSSRPAYNRAAPTYGARSFVQPREPHYPFSTDPGPTYGTYISRY